MISINLLKQISGSTNNTGRRPNGFLKTFIVAAIGAGIIVAGVKIMHRWREASYRLSAISWHKAETKVTGAMDTVVEAGRQKNVVTARTQAAPDTARTDTVKTKSSVDAAPAIVTAVAEKVEPGPGERTAYEIVFADRVFSILAAVIPDDIAFTSISLDSFARVSMVGQSPNRESIGRLFGSLPQDIFQLDPPPRSFIRPADSAGYCFQIGSNVAYSNPLPADTVGQEKVPPEVAAFSGLLKTNNIAIRKEISLLSTENAGEYRRFRYSLLGSGTLPDLIAFVHAVHEARVHCSFRRLHLLAASKGKMSIDADVDFITRH
jgi:hypothetical protein